MSIDNILARLDRRPLTSREIVAIWFALILISNAMVWGSLYGLWRLAHG